MPHARRRVGRVCICVVSRYHVQRSGLGSAIHDLVARGGLYSGASAGAILAGATVKTCEWKVGSR